MKICAPPPPKRFYFFWSTVGIFTLFLGPRAPGQGLILVGASGWGSLCSSWWGSGDNWREPGPVLSQVLRTPLFCQGLSVPTGPMGGARICGLRVLRKSMRPKIFWDCGLTSSQHPHSPEQSIFIN